MLGLLTEGIDFSLVLYLAVVAPTLLAVLLASLLDRPTSGWQT
jgi:chromate transport protein ChrA